MIDKIYFGLSILFFIAGALGIFTPDIPGITSIFAGTAIFALLTQFRDINFYILLGYTIITILAVTAPKLLRTEKLTAREIVNKRELVISFKKNLKSTLVRASLLVLELLAANYIIRDFVQRVTSRF